MICAEAWDSEMKPLTCRVVRIKKMGMGMGWVLDGQCNIFDVVVVVVVVTVGTVSGQAREEGRQRGVSGAVSMGGLEMMEQHANNLANPPPSCCLPRHCSKVRIWRSSSWERREERLEIGGQAP